jgi:DNA mismatch endonuclease (patch repair protein)
MRSVPRTNSSPEVRVRRVAHRAGYRFRLHRKDLAGTPDIVFPKYKAVLFVHGCFWHRHLGCRKTTSPSRNAEFWSEKFAHNIQRDRRVVEKLEEQGWKVGVIWECETRDEDSVRAFLESLLTVGDGKAHPSTK